MVRQIRATVLETLERLEVKDAKVTVVDKGALDCTLKARVEGAVFRASGYSEDVICAGKKLTVGRCNSVMTSEFRPDLEEV